MLWMIDPGKDPKTTVLIDFGDTGADAIADLHFTRHCGHIQGIRHRSDKGVTSAGTL